MSIAIADRVGAALTSGGAVVALETTLVTHGLPHPEGLETARALEAEVRAAGAEPATLGVLDGVARVGLTADELAALANTPSVHKLGPGNLAACMAVGGSGSTTVAATAVLAARAGIAVFATGGIGGVHRGAERTDDVSADLVTLARTPIAVVCSGAKAILDLPRTLERLETLGVPVIGLQTDEFPSFYRRDSGLPVDARVDDVVALARTLRVHWSLSGTGVIVANPVPEPDALPAGSFEQALAGAFADAEQAGVRGRAVTPYLLERLRVRTGGATVTANLALLKSNARVAGALAVALAAGGRAPRRLFEAQAPPVA